MTDPLYRVCYILDGHTPVPCDLTTWARWFGTADRRVASDRIGPFTISTVFLGVDHRFGEEGPPLLFETMVFSADCDGDEAGFGFGRCATWDEAEAQHTRAVAEARERLS